jgi:AcrB/AcrD/AcrF family protein
MIAGMVPMAVGWSEGGEQTAPLGRAVIGGLAAATVATLIVLPTVFALVQGKASHESASLDPDDPTSPHYHEEEEESREPARPSADGELRVPQPQEPDRGSDTSAASGHDPKH